MCEICSKLTIKTPERRQKHRFTLFWCFHCWLGISKCWLGYIYLHNNPFHVNIPLLHQLKTSGGNKWNFDLKWVNLFMPAGTKRSRTLKQTYMWKLQICFSMWNVLVAAGMKGFARMEFLTIWFYWHCNRKFHILLLTKTCCF